MLSTHSGLARRNARLDKGSIEKHTAIITFRNFSLIPFSLGDNTTTVATPVTMVLGGPASSLRKGEEVYGLEGRHHHLLRRKTQSQIVKVYSGAQQAAPPTLQNLSAALVGAEQACHHLAIKFSWYCPRCSVRAWMGTHLRAVCLLTNLGS